MGLRFSRALISGAGWRDEAAYFVIFNVTNVLNYAYLAGMGALLSTESYGLFGALFGLAYLGSALGNTVKVAVTRHVASLVGASEGQLERRVVRVTLAWAAGLTAAIVVALLAVSPLLRTGLHSPLGPVVWTVLAIALSVWVPAGYGLLQGTQRFAQLGVVLFASAVLRMVAGSALVVAGGGVGGAMAGVALGWAGSGLVALWFLRGATTAGERAGDPVPRLQSLAAVLVASVAIAAPTSLDVVLVKHFLPALDAGMYTSVAVLGRAVLFVPVAVSFVVLPKAAARVARGDDPSPLLWGSLALTGVLAGGTAAVLALTTSGLGWSPVGGEISGAITPLQWYLPAMVAFALVAAIIYYQVGCGNNRHVFALLVPGVFAQALLIVLFHGSLTAVAQVMFALNFLLLAASLLAVAKPRLPALRLAPAPPTGRAWRPELPPSD